MLASRAAITRRQEHSIGSHAPALTSSKHVFRSPSRVALQSLFLPGWIGAKNSWRALDLTSEGVRRHRWLLAEDVELAVEEGLARSWRA